MIKQNPSNWALKPALDLKNAYNTIYVMWSFSRSMIFFKEFLENTGKPERGLEDKLNERSLKDQYQAGKMTEMMLHMTLSCA